MFAIGLVCALGADWAGLAVGFGSSVGNRPAALPAGLRVELDAPGMPGRLPTGSGEVTVSGTGGRSPEFGGAPPRAAPWPGAAR